MIFGEVEFGKDPNNCRKARDTDVPCKCNERGSDGSSSIRFLSPAARSASFARAWDLMRVFDCSVSFAFISKVAATPMRVSISAVRLANNGEAAPSKISANNGGVYAIVFSANGELGIGQAWPHCENRWASPVAAAEASALAIKQTTKGIKILASSY